jgi:hypothetical protein
MAKFAGRGLVFRRNTTGTTYVTIPNVRSVDGDVGSTRDLIDASAFGDDWKDFLVGQQEGGELSFTIIFDPADTQHAALQTDYAAGARKKFKIEHVASAKQWDWEAELTSFTLTPDREDAFTATIGMKIVNPGVAMTTLP